MALNYYDRNPYDYPYLGFVKVQRNDIDVYYHFYLKPRSIQKKASGDFRKFSRLMDYETRAMVFIKPEFRNDYLRRGFLRHITNIILENDIEDDSIHYFDYEYSDGLDRVTFRVNNERYGWY